MRRDTSAFRPSPHRQRQLAERAALMRQAPTCSEARLFEALRRAQLGVTFRRQVPLLGRYIVDLLASEVRLIVEVDGEYHTRRQPADERRDRALAAAGYRVVRVPAKMVMGDLEAAVATVRAAVTR
jgi:very-short-patch-repair endonuclease